MASILIDTNLLVYLVDQNEPARQAQAQAVLAILELHRNRMILEGVKFVNPFALGFDINQWE